MEQLISIETVPISIRYVESKPESSEEVSGAQNRAQAPGEAPKAAPPAKPAPARMDAFVPTAPAQPMHITYTASASYDRSGEVRLDLQMKSSDEAQLIRQQMGKDISQVVGRLLRGDSEASFLPAAVSIRRESEAGVPGSGQSGLTFTPPSFELEILERPKVIIKYVGGPIYIPRSADPDYDGEDSA